jgi:hypothetical protein
MKGRSKFVLFQPAQNSLELKQLFYLQYGGSIWYGMVWVYIHMIGYR